MNHFLLDTNVISDVVAGIPEVKARYQLFAPNRLYVSTVTLKEIEYGFRRNPERALKIRAPMRALLSSMNTLEFNVNDANRTGTLRATLALKGTPIGPWDAMIAGTALARGLTLVTANTREFSRVPDLQIEDWRKPINEVRDERMPYGIERYQAA